MSALERPRDAERAYTSIVEMQASESESHALLAEIRQKQNRWPEAIEQWEQVARIRSLEPTGLLAPGRRPDPRKTIRRRPGNAPQARDDKLARPLRRRAPRRSSNSKNRSRQPATDARQDDFERE